MTKQQLREAIRRIIKAELNEGKNETVKTKYGNLTLTQDEDGEWEYSFKGSKGGVGQGMTDGGFSSKEAAIKDFEKTASRELDENAPAKPTVAPGTKQPTKPRQNPGGNPNNIPKKIPAKAKATMKEAEMLKQVIKRFKSKK